MLHALAVITLSTTFSQVTGPLTPLQKSWEVSNSFLGTQFGLDDRESNDSKPLQPDSPKPTNGQSDYQNPAPDSATSQGESSSKRQLPDKPIPKDIIPRDGCPDVDGAPCANFGGFRFFRNTTFTEHDRTWGQAMSHPSMWLMATAVIASTIFDAEGTQHCMAAKTCVEGDPIFGKHPSRLRVYATSAPLVAFNIYSMGYLKKDGRGFQALFVGLVPTALHIRFGMEGWAYASRRRK